MIFHRSSMEAVALAFLAVAAGCGGAEANAVGPYDPAQLAALASPVVCPQAPPAPVASEAPAAPTPATPAATAPMTIASATPAAPPVPAWDGSKARHLLRGVVTGPSNKPVANAVVFLEDGPVEENRGRHVTIGQKDMNFVPFLSVVSHGGSVTFANDDPFPHNVRAFKPEHFDFGMMSQHSVRMRTFEKQGAYQLTCNLHPNMIAYVYVAPGSYFATTNGQGKYSIKDVPEGAHPVGVWAMGLSADPATATIAEGDGTLDITLHK